MARIVCLYVVSPNTNRVAAGFVGWLPRTHINRNEIDDPKSMDVVLRYHDQIRN